MAFIKKYKHLFLLFLFFAIFFLYFITPYLNIGNFNVIHLKADDFIPFIPAFIIPYYIWYLYVPLPMFYMGIKNKNIFYLQCLTLFSGSILCGIFFMIYPTCIDFRPTELGNDFFSKLCLYIYNADEPKNVFPSLHCYEAMAIYLSTFCVREVKTNKIVKTVFAILLILICLSTVFVKQHSIIDAIVGCLFALIVFYASKAILKKRGIL